MRRGTLVSLLAWALGSMSIGCDRIVGIEAAHLDPELATTPLCSEFCATVMQNCTGDFAVYESTAACLAVCAHLPPGRPGDVEANTVYCRLDSAHPAGDTGAPNCPAASPGGFGVCGADCDGYCVLLQQVCPARFTASYRDLVDCGAQCSSLPTSGAFDLSQSSGNTVNCRLWNVSAAALDPETFCGPAAGDAPCT